jgi:hypothetical protein
VRSHDACAQDGITSAVAGISSVHNYSIPRSDGVILLTCAAIHLINLPTGKIVCYLYFGYFGCLAQWNASSDDGDINLPYIVCCQRSAVSDATKL